MTNQENYEALKENLLTIAVNKLSKPGMPVDTYLVEAEDKKHYAIKDKDKLVAAGLKEEYITSLPIRIGALRHAQSLWTKESEAKSIAEKDWKLLSEDAMALHRILIHDFKFAYRNDEEGKKVVDKIAEGSGYGDMVQDFSDLHVLGTANPQALLDIGFDNTKLEKALELSNSMGPLLSTINGERDENDKPSKEMRDRAYVYLKEAVDQICEYGKYVFWEDEERLEKYSSAYFRKLREEREEKEESITE
ncbi:hypothetical protein [Marinifilum sp. D714]|uniref:hypothetical protein n=1 Tax=Marinifilum sp. D714 TaxID=2937523 RepID=UPI0027C4AE43|nr:hypothetical protein [Marinifilum sp. D714]MDQ2179674.1 hypothetical protein [Marinifilum sp. D714]